MNPLSMFQDENGQWSMTRICLFLVMLCLVTEWQKAIWSGVEWSPDAWRMSTLGSTGIMKLYQKHVEKKK